MDQMEQMPEGWNKRLPGHRAVWQFMVCLSGVGREGRKTSPSEFALAPQDSKTQGHVCLSREWDCYNVFSSCGSSALHTAQVKLLFFCCCCRYLL